MSNRAFLSDIDEDACVKNLCLCYIGTNVMRRLLIQKYKLDEDFELSQNYLFFYGMCVHVEAILKYKLIRS